MFRRVYEAPEDQGGGAPVADAPEQLEEQPVEEAPEPEMYTREQIAEAFGPGWERFAGHEGLDAVRNAGQSYNEAVGLIGRGAHLEPQDPELYARLGVEPPQFVEEEPEPEYQPSLYGAPWAPPESWDELVDLAQPVRANGMPGNPKAAFEFANSQHDFDDATKAQFFANWAHYDQAGAFAYQQQAIQAAADARVAQVQAEFEERLRPIEQGTMEGNARNMLAEAAQNVQGFYEYRPQVLELMAQKRQTWGVGPDGAPHYDKWFFHATQAEQVQELADLTAVAIFRTAPAEQAAAEEEAAATERKKVQARTETGRFAGSTASPQGEQSEFKKKNLQDFQTLKDQGML